MSHSTRIPDAIKTQTFLYPTDTIFGLGCDAFNSELVEKMYEIKERPLQKSFVLLVATQVQLMDLVKVPEMAWELMELSDKPLTLVYDTPLGVPDFLLNSKGTIAIRLTHDWLCKKIIQKVKNPIISTSANISNEPNPKHYSEINSKILEKVDYIFPESKTFVPHYDGSSIIQISEGGLVKVLRA